MKKYVFMVATFLLSQLLIINVDARRGCCSWHGGVTSSCSGGKIVCQDGTTSPSCTCDGGSTNNSSSTRNYAIPSYTYGCTDPNATNYNSSANKDDGSCITKILGCMDNTAINYNGAANTSDGSCQFEKITTAKTTIKYKTKYVYSSSKKEGTVKRKGKKGKKEVTTRTVIDEASNVISSEIINTNVIKKSKNKIVYTRKKNKVTKTVKKS